jgi:hypothetical protein
VKASHRLGLHEAERNLFKALLRLGEEHGRLFKLLLAELFLGLRREAQ